MCALIPYGRPPQSLLTNEDSDSFPLEEAVGVNDAVLDSKAEPVLDTRSIGLDGGIPASKAET